VQQNPELLRALIRDRQSDLQRTAEATARRQYDSGPGSHIETARNAAGWLLIDLGLRLAMQRNPIHPSAARRLR
jgi:hypothetical protein